MLKCCRGITRKWIKVTCNNLDTITSSIPKNMIQIQMQTSMNSDVPLT